MATTIEMLARDPVIQADLRGDPELIPELLEEVLRSDGPFQFHYRFTTVDSVLGDMTIPAHSRVLLLWAAANRPGPDDDTTVATDRSAPARRPHHYAFGRGLHFCIGAPLARLEARVVVERLLERTSTFSLAEAESPVRRPSISLRRHVTLPLRVVGA